MNPMIVLALGLLLVVSQSDAIFLFGTGVGTGVTLGTTLGGTGALSGAGFALGAGAAIAGGFALGALVGQAVRNNRRGRRFRRDVDAAVFQPNAEGVLLLEPIYRQLEILDEEDCAKLYLCDLAARDPESWDDKETILVSLFADEKGIPVDSSKSPYDLALRLGFLAKDSALCRKRYFKCNDSDIQ